MTKKQPVLPGALKTAVVGCGIFGSYHVRALRPRSWSATRFAPPGGEVSDVRRTHCCVRDLPFLAWCPSSLPDLLTRKSDGHPARALRFSG